jgi:dihydroorotase
MNVLIKSCTIIDSSSPYNGKICDVLIADGTIQKIGTVLNDDALQIDATGKYLSPGFFDLNANLGELGLETKEDFETGSHAAMAGGFTGLALMPNTKPAVDAKSQVEYLINRANGNLVDIHPIGSISQKREGEHLAEMFDMHQSGAIAFSDGDSPVQNAGLMVRALLYARGFGALIMAYAEDKELAGSAKINEGATSTLLGMKGIPDLAEELMLNRDIYLAEYTESKIHFSTISTAHSVELIRKAKQKGLQITCDVSAHHLLLTDDVLMDFDSNYKVKPPLRIQKDREALIAGLKDNTIDAIVSQHTPQEKELKEVEFEIAAFGMLGLQTAFSIALKAGLTVTEIVDKMAINPRKILGLSVPNIGEGQKANLVLFDVDTEWEYNQQNNFSKSENSPFLGSKIKGKVWLCLNNGQVWKAE